MDSRGGGGLLVGAASPAGRISDAQASEQKRITAAKGRATASGAGLHSSQIEAQPASSLVACCCRLTMHHSDQPRRLLASSGRPPPGRRNRGQPTTDGFESPRGPTKTSRRAAAVANAALTRMRKKIDPGATSLSRTQVDSDQPAVWLAAAGRSQVAARLRPAHGRWV